MNSMFASVFSRGRWCVTRLCLAMLSVLALSAVAHPVHAQTSTGTLRGRITAAVGGAPITDAEIQATNVSTGAKRGTTSKEDGAYVIPGMIPGVYNVVVRRIGSGAQTRQVVVQVGATQLENFALTQQAVQLQGVSVTAAPAVETRTSEVATNITPAQLQNLPTSDRNFLDLAALAPGVTVSEDRIDQQQFRTVQAGGQPPTAVNLYIDGTSFKNDLTFGGIAGQDASRGNPFPRNAVQEYRVISQNFKAEYQKASSALITATTKSGGNTWSGSAIYDYQNASMVSLDTFQRAAKHVADSIAVKTGFLQRFRDQRMIARWRRSALVARSSRTRSTCSVLTRAIIRTARTR